MKLVLVGVFVFFFVVLPMYALDALLLPALNSLQQTYENAGQLSQAIADQAQSN